MRDIINMITEWGTNDSQIEAIVLVGSFARQANKPDSDIDVCIITEFKEELLYKISFIHHLGNVKNFVIEYWGACTSIRVWFEEGEEVEFGLVEPSWYSTPLDQGTHKVLNDGYQILVDKQGILSNKAFPIRPLLGKYSKN
ncbi:nucleotidyltransferase domain-containing protein [Anaerosporobacter sp.]|uniref:nucleotidyltransferase domain-containing protein n=1 Tax=Anaerosporobacter sp. TaxID=1872529 RepID=UPI00286F2C68|nr:nucleotidyltransferase domain-containing protein [Anaerosporobacter sp.]